MANYKKQVLITSIKSQQHYIIYQVPPNRHENLLKYHPFKIYKLTKKQIVV